MSFADIIFPPTPGQTIFAITVDKQTYTSLTNPSKFNPLIDIGKTPYATFTYNIQSNMTVQMATNKDPYISYQVNVTNNSSVTQFYQVAVGIGISDQSINSDFVQSGFLRQYDPTTSTTRNI